MINLQFFIKKNLNYLILLFRYTETVGNRFSVVPKVNDHLITILSYFFLLKCLDRKIFYFSVIKLASTDSYKNLFSLVFA